VIAPMGGVIAGRAFFLDVGDLAICSDFTIAASDAATAKGRESEQSNQTHHCSSESALSNYCTDELPSRTWPLLQPGAIFLANYRVSAFVLP